MARPKKYTERTLSKAVERYFDSITREITVTEKQETDQRDDKGHVIYKTVPVENKLGEPVKVTEYIVPPTVGGLCAFLGIHRSTWAEWCDKTKHPEFSDTTTRAVGRMRAWNEQELLTRSGKDIKGVIFNLENNYGYRERLGVTDDTVEDFLQRLAEEGTSCQTF